jgi:azurin
MRSRTREKTFLAVLTLIVALATSAVSAAAGADERRTIRIVATDAMKYSVQRIEAKPGEKLKILLTSQSSMPKAEMAHNWVLLAADTKVDAFILAAAMARQTDYIPASQKAQVLAATPLAGAGETVSVELEAPAAPGVYVVVCSFPGHYVGGMKGTLVVAK